MGKFLENILDEIGIEAFGEKADRELKAKKNLRKIVLDEKVRMGYIENNLAEMIEEFDSIEFPRFVLGVYLIEEISYHLALFWSEYNHLVDVFLEMEEPENILDITGFRSHKATLLIEQVQAKNMEEVVWLEETRSFKSKMDVIIEKIFKEQLK